MKILIIDNTIDPNSWGSAELCRLARLTPQSTLHVRRAPHSDLPSTPKLFDRIIVSGSKTSALDDAPWIDDLLNFIKKSVDLNIPFLGVCYGHQMLARALSGKTAVRKAQEAEFGWTQINMKDSFPLAQDLPSSFHTFSAHYDEVCELPKGMRNFAQSEICPIQACQLENRPIYGIQFHPEKTAADALKTFGEMKTKKDRPPLLNAARTQELYNPKIGEILFRNFLQSS